MPTAQDALLTTQVFLDTLARSAEARQSRAGAFVHVHAQVILACLRAGYGAAQIYQGLEDLGFDPPMSARQFRRYVRRLGQAADITHRTPLPPARDPAVRAAATTPEPGVSPDPAPVPTKSAGQTRPPAMPTTFAWDPTADIDDLR